MEKETLNVTVREEKGKGAARSLRRGGSLPAVVYRAGGSTPLSMDAKEFTKLIRHTEGQQAILNLQFPDKSTKLALMKEYQVHPVSGKVLHADFQEVASDEKVTLYVAVHLTGEAIGVKRDKGILEHMLRQIEVTCLPDNIPSHIDLDVTEVEAGHSLHVSDITVPAGVEIVTEPEEVVLLVAIPSVVEEAVPEEEAVEGEAAEGEAPEAEAASEEKAEKKEEASEKKEGS